MRFLKQISYLFLILFFFVSAYLIGNRTAYIHSLAMDIITPAKTGDWGLRYQEDGSSPTGNLSAEELKKYNAYYINPTQKKTIYLTFDAGYENGYTSHILDILKKHKVPATFFVVGPYIKENPNLIKRMVSEGHLVGNHTYHHKSMEALSDPNVFLSELQTVEQEYEKTIGSPMPKLYRPPQGKYNTDNLSVASSLGYKTFFWSLAYVDWYQDAQPSREEAFSKLIPRIHPGAIVLLHSTSATNAQILDELLTQWKEIGYSFESLAQL